MRDRNDNAVIVCSIENLDPMGVQGLGRGRAADDARTRPTRSCATPRSPSCARSVVETGGANIQFARERGTGELRVIEMNPRVSRSSALASKATGYPIAKVAAKLAVGHTLDEIPNDLTRTAYELRADSRLRGRQVPALRRFEKFAGADPTLGTQMKSVGEAMGIGRTFAEAFMKAMRSRELGQGPRHHGPR